MTSSSYFELVATQAQAPLVRWTVSRHDLPWKGALPHALRTDRPAQVQVTRSETSGRIRWRLGSDLVAVLGEGTLTAAVDVSNLLRDQCGEALFLVEGQLADEEWDILAEVAIPLMSPPEIVSLYDTIISDLESIHGGLARDILARTQRGAGRSPRPVFDPEVEHRRLADWQHRLSRALQRIRLQPSTTLVRERRQVRWRPGTVVENRSIADLPRDREARFEGRRPVAIGRVLTRTPRLTSDIPEHRHLRSGVLALARRADVLAEGCQRAADLLAGEQRRWGLESGDRPSVYSERFAPRVDRLQRLQREGLALADGFRTLVRKHAFLASAGRPRTAFGPTPAFLARPAYRDAYEVLRDAWRDRGVRVFGHEVPVQFKSLDLLFEYWLYVKAAGLCTEILGQRPSGDGSFQLIHDLYRPELGPGQSFRWDLDGGVQVVLHYEPEFPPAWSSRQGPFGWRASLVGAPLRPDVLLSVLAPGRPPLALVLDAKNTSRFERSRLFEISDYRTLVHDPVTGHQPIRQVILVHRDTRSGTHCSLPGYLEGRLQATVSNTIVGAVPLLPAAEQELRRVLVRFMGDCLPPAAKMTLPVPARL